MLFLIDLVWYVHLCSTVQDGVATAKKIEVTGSIVCAIAHSSGKLSVQVISCSGLASPHQDGLVDV